MVRAISAGLMLDRLAQYATTVPAQGAYWHAAIHLGLSTQEL